MRGILLYILLLTISIEASAQNLGRYPVSHGYSVSTTPTWTNLVGHWPMLNNDLSDVHGSDDMTATGAVNSGDSCFYFDGVGDFLSFTGTVNKVVTMIIEFYPDGVGTCDIFGTSTGAGLELYAVATNRPRVVIGGGSGTTVPVLSFTDVQWNLISIVADDVSGDGDVVYGVDGAYETEIDWSQTVTVATDRVGNSGPGADIKGYVRNIWIFSDQKTQSYITAMNGTEYADGDPE